MGNDQEVVHSHLILIVNTYTLVDNDPLFLSVIDILHGTISRSYASSVISGKCSNI